MSKKFVLDVLIFWRVPTVVCDVFKYIYSSTILRNLSYFLTLWEKIFSRGHVGADLCHAIDEKQHKVFRVAIFWDLLNNKTGYSKPSCLESTWSCSRVHHHFLYDKHILHLLSYVLYLNEFTDHQRSITNVNTFIYKSCMAHTVIGSQ